MSIEPPSLYHVEVCKGIYEVSRPQSLLRFASKTPPSYRFIAEQRFLSFSLEQPVVIAGANTPYHSDGKVIEVPTCPRYIAAKRGSKVARLEDVGYLSLLAKESPSKGHPEQFNPADVAVLTTRLLNTLGSASKAESCQSAVDFTLYPARIKNTSRIRDSVAYFPTRNVLLPIAAGEQLSLVSKTSNPSVDTPEAFVFVGTSISDILLDSSKRQPTKIPFALRVYILP